MENISLGQIASAITLLGVIIGAMIAFFRFFKGFISRTLHPIDRKILNLQQVSIQDRNHIELELIKMFLVNFIHDIEQGTFKSEIQIKNAYELYDRYQKLGGNSYVHDSWEKLMKDGKI